jgi:uncharacterized protein
MADVLVVMAKKPAPGAVKSRLAPRLGADGAAELYRAFLRDLHARLTAAPWRLLWAVHPPGSDLGADLGAPVEQIDQRGADLGERMWNCFAALCPPPTPGGDRIVMIGADVPHLPRQVVTDAFAALAGCDVVLQPTRDGGYCLVGLRRCVDLFRGIPMGTAEVCRLTLQRARELGLKVVLLPETFDVDEPADLDELAALLRRGEAELPFSGPLLSRFRVPSSRFHD